MLFPLFQTPVNNGFLGSSYIRCPCPLQRYLSDYTYEVEGNREISIFFKYVARQYRVE